MPQVGVGAVIFDGGGRVLLVRRGKAPGRGLWSVPGGKVRCGETLRAACRREVREETGLWVEVGPLVEVVEYIDARFHYVILDYLAFPKGGTLQAGGDAMEVRWIPVERIPHLPATEGLSAVIRKAGEISQNP